jgi:hypothetical protein
LDPVQQKSSAFYEAFFSGGLHPHQLGASVHNFFAGVKKKCEAAGTGRMPLFGISLDKVGEMWSLDRNGDGVHRNRRSADNSYQKGSVRVFLWRKEQTTNPSLRHGTFFPVSATPAIGCISHP